MVTPFPMRVQTTAFSLYVIQHSERLLELRLLELTVHKLQESKGSKVDKVAHINQAAKYPE